MRTLFYLAILVIVLDWAAPATARDPVEQVEPRWGAGMNQLLANQKDAAGHDPSQPSLRSVGDMFPEIALPWPMAIWSPQIHTGDWFYNNLDPDSEGFQCTHEAHPWAGDSPNATPQFHSPAKSICDPLALLHTSGISNTPLNIRLRTYLQADWPARVTSVEVGRRLIRIEGHVNPGKTNLYLAEIPPFVEPLNSDSFTSVIPFIPDKQGDFAITVKRRAALDGQRRDCLFSRWAVVSSQDGNWQWLSVAHYADSIAAQWQLPVERSRGKKGLSGFSAGREQENDLDELGIASVTVNIGLDQLIHDSSGPHRRAFVFGGRTWFSDNAYVSKLDRTLRAAARRHIIVSAIILAAPTGRFPQSRYARELAYPGATTNGIYVMPNLTSRDGFIAFAAALDFLCQRYSRPHGRHGRIDNWILGNEVDSGWVWTNAGEQPALCYLNLYYRALRVMDLLTRQYNSHAGVFISLDHFWSENSQRHCYPGRQLLEDLLDFSKAEGDFDWGIAFHPYPKNLFDPKAWLDASATTNLNTPLVTFKNIGVLVQWAKQPRARFDGKVVRAIHLTEQGFNSRDYSSQSLKEQAAGLAYAWRKIECVNAIQEMDYYRGVDSRGEDGLRVGLRKFADDPEDPSGRKPIWYLYQALGANHENQAMDFALPIIGITNWCQAP